jgi:hypothetical protein
VSIGNRQLLPLESMPITPQLHPFLDGYSYPINVRLLRGSFLVSCCAILGSRIMREHFAAPRNGRPSQRQMASLLLFVQT